VASHETAMAETTHTSRTTENKMSGDVIIVYMFLAAVYDCFQQNVLVNFAYFYNFEYTDILLSKLADV
jgi:hypothetical protein